MSEAPYKPADTAEDEVRERVENGDEVLFVTADAPRAYGRVTIERGRLNSILGRKFSTGEVGPMRQDDQVGPSSLNPYRSPESDSSTITSSCKVTGDPGAPLNVALIKSATLFRHVRLSGRMNADITWNANYPHEFVSVNGRKVVAEFAVYYIPRFVFEMHSNGVAQTVTVECCVTLVFFTRAFRISIDGQAVYSEGDCSRLESTT